MAKTQAEYQREYRARKKLTQVSNAPESNAPESLVSNAPSVTGKILPQILPQILPADVLAEIEKMCSENNNGQRASSHGRVAMVERAMRYQERCGHR